MIDPLMRPFDVNVQQRAFGPPGEPGDAGGVEYFATRILIAYEAMLDWAAEMRAVRTEPPFEHVVELACGYVKGSISQVRTFVERLCADLDRALEESERGKEDGPPLVIEADLTLEIDPAVISEFDKELKRAKRKLRWGL